LSFERRDPTRQHLACLRAICSHLSASLAGGKISRLAIAGDDFSRDGYEPGMIYRALQPWQRLYPDLLDVVTLATLLEGSGGQARQEPRRLPSTSDPELATHILHKRISRLGKQIRHAAPIGDQQRLERLSPSPPATTLPRTRATSSSLLRGAGALPPARVLDIGANTGPIR
jgi:hypothetical protein